MPLKNQTFFLFACAVLVAVLSALAFLTSVREYCERRSAFVFLAVGALVIVALLVKNWPPAAWKRMLSALAILLCLITIGGDVWYFKWTTDTCKPTLDRTAK